MAYGFNNKQKQDSFIKKGILNFCHENNSKQINIMRLVNVTDWSLILSGLSMSCLLAWNLVNRVDSNNASPCFGKNLGHKLQMSG